MQIESVDKFKFIDEKSDDVPEVSIDVDMTPIWDTMKRCLRSEDIAIAEGTDLVLLQMYNRFLRKVIGSGCEKSICHYVIDPMWILSKDFFDAVFKINTTESEAIFPIIFSPEVFQQTEVMNSREGLQILTKEFAIFTHDLVHYIMSLRIRASHKFWKTNCTIKSVLFKKKINMSFEFWSELEHDVLIITDVMDYSNHYDRFVPSQFMYNTFSGRPLELAKEHYDHYAMRSK